MVAWKHDLARRFSESAGESSSLQGANPRRLEDSPEGLEGALVEPE